MSGAGLRELLADPAQNGAYFVELHDRETCVEAAASLDFALVPIDFTSCRDKDDALERIAQALRFPDWFGGNWDALGDCLGDLSWWPARGYMLLFDRIGEWRAADADAFVVLLDVVSGAGMQWRDARVSFWAVMPLPADELPDPGDDASADA
jgi:RNAse (barnase) inhibitor barstar